MEIKRTFILVALTLSIVGCAAFEPADPNTLSNLQGSYKIVDQYAPKDLHLTGFDVYFMPSKIPGQYWANLTVRNGQRTGSFHLDECIYPGDRAARYLGNSEDAKASEVIRCRTPRTRHGTSPTLYLVRSIDGHELIYHPDGNIVLAAFGRPLHGNTGLMAILNWGTAVSTGYMLQRADH